MALIDMTKIKFINENYSCSPDGIIDYEVMSDFDQLILAMIDIINYCENEGRAIDLANTIRRMYKNYMKNVKGISKS